MDKKHKRKRGGNWLEEDKTLLKQLVKENVAAIENKKTDTNSNQKKRKAWLQIEEIFNALCQGGRRNVPQLKSQWTLTKMQAKKAHSVHRKLFIQNNGEPKTPLTDLPADDIGTWLPNEYIIENKFDPGAIMSEQNAIFHKNLTIPIVPEPNISQIVEHSNPIKLEKGLEEDLEQPLISEIEEDYVEAEEFPEKHNIKKKIRLPVLSQSITSSKIKILSEVQRKNLEELHLIQMDNERKRGRNLDLEYEILQDKKKLIKKKLNDND